MLSHLRLRKSQSPFPSYPHHLILLRSKLDEKIIQNAHSHGSLKDIRRDSELLLWAGNEYFYILMGLCLVPSELCLVQTQGWAGDVRGQRWVRREVAGVYPAEGDGFEVCVSDVECYGEPWCVA